MYTNKKNLIVLAALSFLVTNANAFAITSSNGKAKSAIVKKQTTTKKSMGQLFRRS